MTARLLPVAAIALVAFSAMPLAGHAENGPAPLRITPKMIQEAAQASPRATSAVFTRDPRERELEEPPLEIFKDLRNVDNIPNACNRGSGELCYDYRSGRTVYKPMRKLLPGIPGLTPHNLSIRRGRIVAHYTFK